MKVLMVAAEMAPFVRTGGLAEVIQTLPLRLAVRGHEVSVVLPCYPAIKSDPRLKMRETGVAFDVQVGAKRAGAVILEGRSPDGTQVFAVRRDEYFDRSSIYTDGHRDYDDNAERFIFFNKAVVEMARRMHPLPDLVHCHDWPTAMIPVFIRDWRLPFATVFTIHNIAYQGNFWGLDFQLTNLPPSMFSPAGVEFYGRLNFLKSGVLFADLVTTVSEQYAREIQTEAFGMGMHHVMRENSGKIVGILNGVDEREWNPATDKFLTKKYSAADLSGKQAAKTRLLRETGLKKTPDGPVMAMVSRVVEHKGFDLLLAVADRLLARDVRLIVLGEGDPAFENALHLLVKRQPGKVAYIKEFSDKLAHLMNAGADISLVPSRFEPCGLSAIHALLYGAIPVVRGVGGLHQIVEPYEGPGSDGYGFAFFDYSSEALWEALVRAMEVFALPDEWNGLVRRAMSRDFTWDDAIGHYESAYQRAVRIAPRY